MIRVGGALLCRGNCISFVALAKSWGRRQEEDHSNMSRLCISVFSPWLACALLPRESLTRFASLSSYHKLVLSDPCVINDGDTSVVAYRLPCFVRRAISCNQKVHNNVLRHHECGKGTQIRLVLLINHNLNALTRASNIFLLFHKCKGRDHFSKTRTPPPRQ